jgi:hypothetical protein
MAKRPIALSRGEKVWVFYFTCGGGHVAYDEIIRYDGELLISIDTGKETDRC